MDRQYTPQKTHAEQELKYSSYLTFCSNIQMLLISVDGSDTEGEALACQQVIKTAAYIMHLSKLLLLTCLVSLAGKEAVCLRKRFREEHPTTSCSKACFAIIPLPRCSEGTQSAMLFPFLSAAQIEEALD